MPITRACSLCPLHNDGSFLFNARNPLECNLNNMDTGQSETAKKIDMVFIDNILNNFDFNEINTDNNFGIRKDFLDYMNGETSGSFWKTILNSSSPISIKEENKSPLLKRTDPELSDTQSIQTIDTDQSNDDLSFEIAGCVFKTFAAFVKYMDKDENIQSDDFNPLFDKEINPISSISTRIQAPQQTSATSFKLTDKIRNEIINLIKSGNYSKDILRKIYKGIPPKTLNELFRLYAWTKGQKKTIGKKMKAIKRSAFKAV